MQKLNTMELLSIEYKHTVKTDIDFDLNKTKATKRLEEQEVIFEWQNYIYMRHSKFNLDGTENTFQWMLEVDYYDCNGNVMGRRFESWKRTKLSEVKNKGYLIGQPKGNGQCNVHLIHPETQKELEEEYQTKFVKEIEAEEKKLYNE